MAFASKELPEFTWLAHGAEGHVVPVQHTRRIASALDAAGHGGVCYRKFRWTQHVFFSSAYEGDVWKWLGLWWRADCPIP